jgi:hypothetical protein
MSNFVNLAINVNGVETNPPQASTYGDATLKGLPTTPNIGRGIYFQTGLGVSNNAKFHICEPFGAPVERNNYKYLGNGKRIPNVSLGAPGLEIGVLLKSAAMQEIIGKIRKAIEDALVTDALSPVVTQIKAAAKYIVEVLKDINFFLTQYIEAAALLIAAEKYINGLITFIKSLPALLAAALKECLDALTNSLAYALTSNSTIDSGGVLQQVRDLQSNLALAESATQQVINGANEIVNNFNTIPQSISAGSNALIAAINSIKNNPPKPIVNVNII